MKFYHISPTFLGPKVTLTAKLPATCVPEYEGHELRVCFCPSIRQCLHAIHSGHNCTEHDAIGCFIPRFYTPDMKNPSVYTTHRKLFKPSERSDFAKTNEHWSLTDIAVTFQAFIDIRAWIEQPSGTVRIPMTDNPNLELSEFEHKIWRSEWNRDQKLIK